MKNNNKNFVKILVIITSSLLILAFISFLSWNFIKSSPRYSLYKMYKAVSDNNYDEFSKYFDIDLVIDSLFSKYEKEQSSNVSDSFSAGLMALFKPSIKEYMKSELKKQMENGKIFGTETIKVKGIKDLNKIWDAIKIKYINKLAQITVTNEKNEAFIFKMKKESDFWKVIEIKLDDKDLSNLTNNLSSNNDDNEDLNSSISPINENYSLKVGSNKITINDQTFTLNAPVLEIGGSTYLPLRFFADRLGAENLHYDENTETISFNLSRNQTNNKSGSSEKYSFKVGSNTITIDDNAYTINAPVLEIGGSTYLPLRFFADRLGAENLHYDENTETISFNLLRRPLNNTNQKQKTMPGLDKSNPIKFGQDYLLSNGFQITILGSTKGKDADKIIEEANMFNNKSEVGMQYIFIKLKLKNIASQNEPATMNPFDFSLVGNSNKVFTNLIVVQPNDGIYQYIQDSLFHNGETEGSIVFYIPSNETNLVLIWNGDAFSQEDTRYFEVK